jgi:hypothetical protein
VAVRVPTGLAAAVYAEGGGSVAQWETDALTPHVLIAQVDELFEDATVRSVRCRRMCLRFCPCSMHGDAHLNHQMLLPVDHVYWHAYGAT